MQKHFLAFFFAFAAACSESSPETQGADDSTGDSPLDNAGPDVPDPGDQEPEPGTEPDDPENPHDDFADRIQSVIIQGDGGDNVQLVAIDSDGVAIGVLGTWIDQNGHAHLDADFQDGYLDAVVIDGQAIVKATLPADVLAERAQAIADLTLIPSKGALKCAVTVASAVALCAPLAALPEVGIFTCPVGVLKSWCACAPVLGIDDGDICDEIS